MVLHGYQDWDEARKAREDAVEQLDIKRLRRNGAFPSGLTPARQLDAVLVFLRETPWSKTRIWRRTKSVPQGSFITLKRRGTEDSCVDVLASVLGLPFTGLEMTPERQLRLQFAAHEKDNCPSPIVVELDTVSSLFGAHRYRSDVNANTGRIDNHSTVTFVGEQLAKSVVAAWEEKTRKGYQLHLLWSDSRVTIIHRDGDTIWVNVIDDLRHVVESGPFASAIAVVAGK
jgi:hypothetical protein